MNFLKDQHITGRPFNQFELGGQLIWERQGEKTLSTAVTSMMKSWWSIIRLQSLNPALRINSITTESTILSSTSVNCINQPKLWRIRLFLIALGTEKTGNSSIGMINHLFTLKIFRNSNRWSRTMNIRSFFRISSPMASRSLIQCGRVCRDSSNGSSNVNWRKSLTVPSSISFPDKHIFRLRLNNFLTVNFHCGHSSMCMLCARVVWMVFYGPEGANVYYHHKWCPAFLH